MDVKKAGAKGGAVKSKAKRTAAAANLVRARAKLGRMSAKRRSELARRAALARWAKRDRLEEGR